MNKTDNFIISHLVRELEKKETEVFLALDELKEYESNHPMIGEEIAMENLQARIDVLNRLLDLRFPKIPGGEDF